MKTLKNKLPVKIKAVIPLKRRILTNYWIRKNKWIQKRKSKKRYISFRERFSLSKRNANKKRYYLFYTRKKNNLFLTVTNVKGNVVASYSAGTCKITTKKKKRAPDTLKTVAESISKYIRAKGIKYIFKFFVSVKNSKIVKVVFNACKQAGILILQAIVLRTRSHGLAMRKKKLKRL